MPDNQFWRDASGRLTFEMFWVSADSYSTVCAGIASAFCLVPETALITNGLDIMFQDYRCGEQELGLAWDNWSGFIVTAKTPESELLVQDIASWLLQSRWATVADSAEPFRGA